MARDNDLESIWGKIEEVEEEMFCVQMEWLRDLQDMTALVWQVTGEMFADSEEV